MTKSLPPKSLVFYADDDADDHQLIREAFEEFAPVIELVEFNNGMELLQYVEELSPLQPSPCLIILDINMPMLDGKQTLKRLRSMNGFKDVPVVLFTTSTLPSEAAFANSYGAGFVTKPLHVKQIHVIIDQLMANCEDAIKERIKKQRGK